MKNYFLITLLCLNTVHIVKSANAEEDGIAQAAEIKAAVAGGEFLNKLIPKDLGSIAQSYHAAPSIGEIYQIADATLDANGVVIPKRWDPVLRITVGAVSDNGRRDIRYIAGALTIINTKLRIGDDPENLVFAAGRLSKNPRCSSILRCDLHPLAVYNAFTNQERKLKDLRTDWKRDGSIEFEEEGLSVSWKMATSTWRPEY